MKYRPFRIAAIGLGLVTLALGVGCKGGGSSSSDPYWHAWYDVYGDYCYTGYPSPGCNFYVDGWKIIDIEDPYYDTDYFLEFDVWEYYDSYGDYSIYVGWAWWSPNGILYDEFGNALNEFGADDYKDRDWSAVVADQEEELIQTAGKDLAERLSLASEAKGVEIARALQNYSYLVKDRKSRQRDWKDAVAVSKTLFKGIDIQKAYTVLSEAKSLNDAAVDEQVNGIAKAWGSKDPEAVKETLKSWFDTQLKEKGLMK